MILARLNDNVFVAGIIAIDLTRCKVLHATEVLRLYTKNRGQRIGRSRHVLCVSFCISVARCLF